MLRKIKMGGAIFILSLLALVGCQSEKLVDDGGSQGGQQFSLTASKGAKSVGSRTALDGNQTIWSEDDAIYVSSEDNEVKGTLYLDPESLSPDKTTATFTGFVIGGDPAKLAYSVFPAPKNGGKIIDLSIIEGGGEVDAPFIGRINTSDDVDVRFKHVCGVAPIVMNGYQGEDIVIKGTNNNTAVKFLSKLDVTKVDLTGEKPEFIIDNIDETENITITSPKGGEMYVPYYLTSTPVENKEGKKVVDFMHGNDVVNKADLTDGFVGKVHATTVVAYTMDENGNSVQNESTESQHQTIEGISTAVVGQGNFSSINSDKTSTSEETQYFNVSALVTVPVDGEENKTQNVVAEAVEVTLPKVELTDDNKDVEKSVEISFTNVAPSTTITIQEESTSGSEEQEKSIDNLTVVLPSGTTAEEAKEQVVIEMPNTTVTVKSADGNVLLIEEAVASTGENTFIISEDVIINGLHVKKGNVDVYGTVKNWIKRHNDNKDAVTTITLYGNAQVGNLASLEKDSNFKIFDRRDGVEIPEGVVTNLREFEAALTNIDVIEVILGGNITIEKPLSIASGEYKQIDLNGYIISMSDDFAWGTSSAVITNDGCEWTLMNGKIEGTTTEADKWLIKSSQRCSIENVTMNAKGKLNAINVENSDITINGSTITSNLNENSYALKLFAQEAHFIAQLGSRSDVHLTGHVGITQNCSSDEGMGHSILSITYGSVKGNLNIDGSQTTPERLNPQVDGCTQIEGENWPEITYMTIKTEAELNYALAQEGISEIYLGNSLELTSPIYFNARKDLFLRQYTLSISDNFNWGDSDAAIIINAPDDSWKVGSRIEGTHKDSRIKGPKTNYPDKYMIKCNGYFELYNFIMDTEGVEHAIKVEDCKFDLTGDNYDYAPTINVTNETGYALDIYANTKDAIVTLNSNGTINGDIRYTKNSNTTSSVSNITVMNGKINGDLVLEGTNKDKIKVTVKDAAPTPNGNGWPTSGNNDNNGGGEVTGNTITIENPGLAKALAAQYNKDPNQVNIKFDDNGYAIISEEFVNNAIGERLVLRDASTVTSLKDLEKLNNVRIVNLSGTGLKEADFSKCTQLEEIYVGGHSLSSIKIDGLTKLHYLDCSNSAFSELSLSSTSLKTLICRSNQLETLNITNLPSLKVLDCGANKISSLTLHNNLTNLDCRGNQLETLNISNIPLVKLHCTSNLLAELYVGDNNQLEVLECGNQGAGQITLVLDLGTDETLYNKWINTWYMYDFPLNNNVKAYFNEELIEFNGGVQQGNGTTGAPNFGIEEI